MKRKEAIKYISFALGFIGIAGVGGAIESAEPADNIVIPLAMIGVAIILAAGMALERKIDEKTTNNSLAGSDNFYPESWRGKGRRRGA